MTRIECLDGLRGLAALWVLIGHCMILTGFTLPILGRPDLGVDLFIYLSGFLMVFQYNIRKHKEDWSKPSVWASFWVRRFFRLSPLYFSLLLIALYFGSEIYEARTMIDAFLDHSPQSPERYTDASLANHVMHLTYVYGLHPDYAFRTALPDWSLTLEMQFYAVFPLLVWTARKIGWTMMTVVVAVAAFAAALAADAAGLDYPMPSFLPLKMHLFLAGMIVAFASGRARLPLLGLALVLVIIPIGGPSGLTHLIVRAVILAGFFALVHYRTVPAIDWASRVLGSPPLHWLGELSYGVYLIHLLALHAVASWVILQWGDQLAPSSRFALTFGAVAVLSYAVSYLTYRAIERPGQNLGRAILMHFTTKRTARQVSAEQIAAP